MKPPDKWQHFNPVRVLGAPGALNQLGTLNTFKRPLLVTSPGFSRRGITKRVREILGDRLTIYDAVTPNPDLDDLDAVWDELRSTEIDGVIALGGGSVLDSGKALAASLAVTKGNFLARMLRSEDGQLPERCLPIIAIPTTAGTGSEVTPFATIWDGSSHRKHSLTGEQLFPGIALLDPQLALTLPRHETLYSALDCISHSLETLWNRHRTPISEGLAIHALHLAVETLPALLDHPDDLGSRTTMQMASLLAGIAISQNRTALAHSISYPLTSHFGVPHGLAASFTLPALIDHIREKDGWPGEQEWRIVDEIYRLLAGLQLHKMISGFVSTPEAIAKAPEMLAPNRANHFILPVDQDTVRSLLHRALP